MLSYISGLIFVLTVAILLYLSSFRPCRRIVCCISVLVLAGAPPLKHGRPTALCLDVFRTYNTWFSQLLPCMLLRVHRLQFCYICRKLILNPLALLPSSSHGRERGTKAACSTTHRAGANSVVAPKLHHKCILFGPHHIRSKLAT